MCRCARTVVILWCRAVYRPRSSSNDVAGDVARSWDSTLSIHGFVFGIVIKLIHLQPVREILGTRGWQYGGFSILASSSISPKLSLRCAFLVSTSVNDSSVVLPLSLVSLVSNVSPVSHVTLSRELLRFICGQLSGNSFCDVRSHLFQREAC